MKIKIIQVGKNKDNYIEEAVQEFIKRLHIFAKIEIVTLKEINPSKTFDKNRVIKEETEQILNHLKTADFIIVLDEKGQQIESTKFSQLLSKSKDEGKTLVFVIGGAFGLTEEIKAKANLLLSLSKMTFTHQMIRIFLLEQIYRGFCILQGKEYHH